MNKSKILKRLSILSISILVAFGAITSCGNTKKVEANNENYLTYKGTTETNNNITIETYYDNESGAYIYISNDHERISITSVRN